MTNEKHTTEKKMSDDHKTESSTENAAQGSSRELIAKHTLFDDVPADILDRLVKGREIRQLQVGDVLLEPGQINTNLYLLLEGQLKVHINRVDEEGGFLIKPDQCAGEISVVDNKPPTAFVVVDEPSLVLVLPEAALWEDLLQVPPIAKNFMRMFADRFRANNQAIQEALEKQRRYEYLQKELAIAYDIQLSMLPHQLNLGDTVDIAAGIQPAQEIGGDFYDAFPVRPDEYAVVIGDVSGNGVPGALFMVRTMTLARSELLKNQSINEALRNLNVTLCQENPTRMFASLTLGILNRRTGRFDYVNAGHDAIVYGAKGEKYQTLPLPTGMLVGIEKNATYDVATVTLEKDDVLFIHTDGITEAKNPDQQRFSLTRLKQCLEETPGSSAGQLADRINRAVHQFTAGASQSDDMTMLILRFLGSDTDSQTD